MANLHKAMHDIWSVKIFHQTATTKNIKSMSGPFRAFIRYHWIHLHGSVFYSYDYDWPEFKAPNFEGIVANGVPPHTAVCDEIS